ncbi:phosphate ABC transporter permease subunit PstC [Salinarchaeum sp. IM2453]|uniref:phosphate ABC transporter permease subunit PstC n=1 Tax=Salinarchaeum sp. IM2453 TaxID=2862870 RepID=UPI001C83BB27|nr:phosphate ABC transporter permease subunit PstC [Salinarchaeum sp. IM2453]QZA87758.1 phosphate ABC transporter permease subunit PstC [Salinarchaeum sp. IM2453]
MTEESNVKQTRLRRRLIVERISSGWLHIAGYFATALLLGIFALLIWESLDLLAEYSLVQLMTSANWDPAQEEFGFLPALVGTLYVTAIAMIIGTPIAIFAATYIAEFAEGRSKAVVSSFIDVLAAVPGVVFGLVGIIVVVPLVGDYIAPIFGAQSTGLSILTAGLVMSIVITPYMISMAVEALESLPDELRESALALGATRWEMIKHILYRGAGPALISATLLGFGRVFGATIVPTMLIGGQTQIPESPFSTGQTLTSTIVNDFGELMTLPLTQSALIFVGVILLTVVLVFNLIATVIRRRLERRWQY